MQNLTRYFKHNRFIIHLYFVTVSLIMAQNFFSYQMQAMQKFKRLQNALEHKPIATPPSLQAFQQSMMQVGMKFWQNMANNPDHLIESQKKYFERTA